MVKNGKAARAAESKGRSKLTRNRDWKLECLEPRLLLFATTGAAWPHPELVTVSFMPDGSSIGGTPSTLFSTLNAKWSSATWQKEILRGLQSYAAIANLNFSVVADDGAPFASAGLTGTDNNVQGDANFGDIRIGAADLGSANLGVGMFPPPINGDTAAGDFFLNSTKTWNIGSTYDLYTVVTHEVGHSLGADHSTITPAMMYSWYNGTKSALNSDDIAAAKAVYGARSQDAFDLNGNNSSLSTADVITTYLDSNKQITLTKLDITTTSDVDWYKITIPSGSAQTMSVQMQSSGLSLLAPKLSLYSSGGSLLSSASGSYGSTVTATRSVSVGNVFYIRAAGADTSVFGTGAYALQVNLGTTPLPAVTSPNTATPMMFTGGTLASSIVAKEDGSDAKELFYKLCKEGLAEWYEVQPAGQDSEAEHAEHWHHTVPGELQVQVGASSAEVMDHADSLSHSDATGRHQHRQPTSIPSWVGGHSRVSEKGLLGTKKGTLLDDWVDHIFKVNPVDVVRPGYALVCDLANR